jgi:hypothetical protein
VIRKVWPDTRITSIPLCTVGRNDILNVVNVREALKREAKCKVSYDNRSEVSVHITITAHASIWIVVTTFTTNWNKLGNVRVTNSVAPETKGSSPHSQQPANDPYPEPDESTPHPQPISLRSILIPSSHLRLVLPSVLFPSFRPKTKQCTHFCPLPCVPHALPTSSALISSS